MRWLSIFLLVGSTGDDGDFTGHDASLVRTADGEIGIAHRNTENGDVLLAWGSPGAWRIATIDDRGLWNLGRGTSALLDAEGFVHLAFVGTGEDTRYYTRVSPPDSVDQNCDGAAW